MAKRGKFLMKIEEVHLKNPDGDNDDDEDGNDDDGDDDEDDGDDDEDDGDDDDGDDGKCKEIDASQVIHLRCLYL